MVAESRRRHPRPPRHRQPAAVVARRGCPGRRVGGRRPPATCPRLAVAGGPAHQAASHTADSLGRVLPYPRGEPDMATTRPRKRPPLNGNAPPKDGPDHPDTLDSFGGIRWLSPEAGRQYFEDEVRKRLGISGDEFLRRLDAGEYRDIP